MNCTFSLNDDGFTTKKKLDFLNALGHVKDSADFECKDIDSLLSMLFKYGFVIKLGEHCYIAENDQFVIYVS